MHNQFIEKVPNYSSEYGSVSSFSYVAQNVMGRPLSYPKYGDFQSSFCMKYYGASWRYDPVEFPQVLGLGYLLPHSREFIDVKIEVKVQVNSIEFYEVYNPGAIVRIWALDEERKKWNLMWSSPPVRAPQKSRLFIPPIRVLHGVDIRTFRIELDATQLDYYYGLDGIVVKGHVIEKDTFESAIVNAIDLDLTVLLNTKIGSEDEILTGVKYLSSRDLWKMFGRKPKTKLPPLDIVDSLRTERYLSKMPDEILIRIFQYLDLHTLIRISACSKHLSRVAKAPMFYRNVNLKNYWWMVSSKTLIWLHSRCYRLTELDLSWCGDHDFIQKPLFHNFITKRCKKLTVLRLSSCVFVDDFVMYAIRSACDLLEVLDVSGCFLIEHGFANLLLPHLIRLNVSRTGINAEDLATIAINSLQLTHLHIADCWKLNLSTVVHVLVEYGTAKLQVLDAWKTGDLMNQELIEIGKFKDLRILDIGWCGDDGALFHAGIVSVLQNCKRLRVLILTSFRNLLYSNIEFISIQGTELEWLDISGATNISTPVVRDLLERRQDKLKHLDISHCPLISSADVKNFQILYPHIAIKGGYPTPI